MSNLNLARTLPLHTRRTVLRRLVAAALVITACGRTDKSPIVLGLAGPFSQPRGVSMRHAAELAVKEVNARGGIRGRELALRVLDDSGRPEVAIRIAQQLVQDPAVVGVLGHLTCSASLAARRVCGDARGRMTEICAPAGVPQLA